MVRVPTSRTLSISETYIGMIAHAFGVKPSDITKRQEEVIRESFHKFFQHGLMRRGEMNADYDVRLLEANNKLKLASIRIDELETILEETRRRIADKGIDSI